MYFIKFFGACGGQIRNKLQSLPEAYNLKPLPLRGWHHDSPLPPRGWHNPLSPRGWLRGVRQTQILYYTKSSELKFLEKWNVSLWRCDKLRDNLRKFGGKLPNLNESSYCQ